MKKWRLLLLLREFVTSLFPGRHKSRLKSSYGLGVEGAHPFDFDDDFSNFDFIRYILTDEEYGLERSSDRTARIYFFLDRTRSMDIGWRVRTRREAQAQLVSLLIEGLADEGNQIGIAAATDRIEFVPILKSGARALRSELENALEKRCEGRATDFRAIHDFIFAEILPGSLVFVISDWESPVLDAGLIEDIDDRVELIPIVLLHGFEEREHWWCGDAAVVDSESGEWVVSGEIKNDHRAETFFEKAGVDALELFIEDDEDTWKIIIQEFFETRKKLRLQRRQR